jgi:hypothetical protein
MSAGLAAAIRAVGADDVQLSELCEALRDGIEPRLRSIRRACGGDMSGRSDEIWNLASHVLSTTHDAARSALMAHDHAVALAEAIRSAEAVASLDPETAEAVVMRWADAARLDLEA